MTAPAEKINLLGMPKAKLEAFFETLGEKRFRAQQVLQWIHQRGVDDFDQMTNMNRVLRERLKEIAEVRGPEVVYDETRSEEHTSELQSRPHLVCRLLLEKKK